MLQQALNTTDAILHSLTHGWKSPKATVIRIEALVVIAAFLSFFLLFFGSWRRWCKHWSVQMGVLVAYILSFSLVTYTIGSMQSSAARNEMFPIWALSLLAVLGCTNSITAYSLDDNKQYIRHIIQQLLGSGYVILIVVTASSSISAAVAIILLFFDTYQKNAFRIIACILACESWHPNKQVADYMESEHTSHPEYDTISMEGYTYLVFWNTGCMKLRSPAYKWTLEAEDDPVTIEKIWKCENGLLAAKDDPVTIDDASGDLKDVCLSFALYQLLMRRYFGFHCAESGQQKTHDFAFKALLKEGSVSDYERAFKVIEAELSFIYDFFYTKYAVVHLSGGVFSLWNTVTIFFICFVGAVTGMRKVRTGSSSDGIVIVNSVAADLVITLSVLASLVVVQVLHEILYWTSDWGKVALVCDYVRRPSLEGFAACLRRIKEFLIRFRLFGKYCWLPQKNKYYWQHKIGQYSLLELYVYHPSLVFSRKIRSRPDGHSSAVSKLCTKIKELCFGRKEQGLERNINQLPLLGALRGKMIMGRVQGDPTELSVEVKTAVIEALLRTFTPSKDVVVPSLLASRVPKVPKNIEWSLGDTDNDVQTILVWHIATCYCEMATSRFCANEEEAEKHWDVATKLSKYCAYLVVFAPKLLPGHHWNTSEMFSEVVKEARRSLGGADNKYETMKHLEEPTETIFQRGTLLGKQLESGYDITQRWNIMADFWTEMILYVAPSGGVEAHIEHLTKGGEFITHLWALLFHAGIVKQEDAKKKKEEPDKQKEEQEMHEEEDRIEVCCSS